MKKTICAALIATALCFSSGAFADDYSKRKYGMDKKADSSAAFYSTIEPASGDPSRVMNLSVSQVRSMQDMLHKQGYAAGPIDGIVGPKTAAAIRAFQKDKGLPVTGTTSNETLQKLGFRSKMDRSRANSTSDIMFDRP